MSNYPTTIPAVMEAISEYYDAPEAVSEAYEAARADARPVPQIKAAYKALRGELDNLDEEGLKVLAGAAELVHTNRWGQDFADALPIRDRARDRLLAGVP